MNSLPAGSKRSSLTGVLPVVQLPFHEDEQIDFHCLSTEIDWLFEQGANGTVMAMVSETLRLTQSERKEVAQHICRHAAGRGDAVISVGAESTFAAVDFARHAESVGATALMAIAPVSVPPLAGELIRYFERIIQAVSIPVIIQDASGYVGRSIGIESMVELLAKFGAERVLFKPEAAPLGPQLSDLRDATQGQARVFEGSGGIALLDNYRRGIVGTMPGSDLIVGVVALWHALEQGDLDRAYSISLPLSSIVSLQVGLDGFLAVEKHLLVRQGVFHNQIVRGPVAYRLDSETRDEVDRLFDLLMNAVTSTV